MKNTKERIWIWLQDNELYKAVYNPTDRTFLVLNERDEILIKYTGLTAEQLTRLEMLFVHIGAKHLDGHTEPFTYL
jgi:hypothetical protein